MALSRYPRKMRNCKVCGAPFVPIVRQIYCKTCRPYKKRTITNCLYCGRKLKENFHYHFCNELCVLAWERIFHRIMSLPIKSESKKEIVDAWLKGDVHQVNELLAVAEQITETIIDAKQAV